MMKREEKRKCCGCEILEKSTKLVFTTYMYQSGKNDAAAVAAAQYDVSTANIVAFDTENSGPVQLRINNQLGFNKGRKDTVQ